MTHQLLYHIENDSEITYSRYFFFVSATIQTNEGGERNENIFIFFLTSLYSAMETSTVTPGSMLTFVYSKTREISKEEC